MRGHASVFSTWRCVRRARAGGGTTNEVTARGVIGRQLDSSSILEKGLLSITAHANPNTPSKIVWMSGSLVAAIKQAAAVTIKRDVMYLYTQHQLLLVTEQAGAHAHSNGAKACVYAGQSKQRDDGTQAFDE